MDKIKKTLEIQYHGGAISAAIDTGIIAFAVMMLSLGVEYSWYARAGISLGVALFIVYVLDMGYHTFLAPTIKGIMAGEHKKHGWLYLYLFVVSMAYGAGSIAVTFYGREAVSHVLVADPELVDPSTTLASIRSASADQVATVEKQLAQLKADQRRAEANAGSASLRNLAAGGNAWAQGELAKAKAKARKPFESAIAEAQASKTSIINAATLEQTTIAQSAASANELKVNGVQSKRLAVQRFQMWFVILSTVLMLAAAIGMGLLYANYGLGDNPLSGIKHVNRSKNKDNTQEPPPPVETPVNNQQPGPPAARPIGFHNNFTDEAVTPVTAAVTNQPVTPVNPVITATLDGLQLNCEFDGVKVYDSPVTGKIVTVLQNGSQLDRTKLRQYISIYGKRAVESKGEATRETNLKKANVFRAALKDIYNETL